ncbi:MAG: glycosyltransferase [Thermoanaerobaculia bacterium]
MPTPLLSLCDWLPPDFGAVGQYALAWARSEAMSGRVVTLVGFSSTGDSVEEESFGSGRLRVVRLAMPVYDRAGLRARAVWTMRANFRLLRAAFRHRAEGAEILFTGSPPFFLHWIVPAKLLLRRPLVYRITDFHPECLIAELGRTPWPLRLLGGWTRFLRRRVDRFEVLGEDQRRRLLEIGIAPERIELRRDESPVRIDESTLPLPLPVELAGRTVLLYSGNFGVAHDDATFLAGYEHHHREGSGEVVLWLNATGAKADRLESELRTRALPVYRSRPVPLEDLARLLVTPHAHLITLRDEFVGYVLPSKVYGCIASGKPVLFVGSEASDVDLLCRERIPERYRRVSVGDAAALAARLDELASGAGRFTGGRSPGA